MNNSPRIFLTTWNATMLFYLGPEGDVKVSPIIYRRVTDPHGSNHLRPSPPMVDCTLAETLLAMQLHGRAVYKGGQASAGLPWAANTQPFYDFFFGKETDDPAPRRLCAGSDVPSVPEGWTVLDMEEHDGEKTPTLPAVVATPAPWTVPWTFLGLPSKAADQPVSMCNIVKASPGNYVPPTTLITLGEEISRGELNRVCRATLTDGPVITHLVAKVTVCNDIVILPYDYYNASKIHGRAVNEAQLYSGRLLPLQGKTVPRFYGLYSTTTLLDPNAEETILVMLLSDEGEPLGGAADQPAPRLREKS